MIPGINDTSHKETFLHDFYPGMKEMPIQLVELMASTHPEKTLNIRANLEANNEPTDDLEEPTDSCVNQGMHSLPIQTRLIPPLYHIWFYLFKFILQFRIAPLLAGIIPVTTFDGLTMLRHGRPVVKPWLDTNILQVLLEMK